MMVRIFVTDNSALILKLLPKNNKYALTVRFDSIACHYYGRVSLLLSFIVLYFFAGPITWQRIRIKRSYRKL